ncbi:MAG: hypothetical protein NTX82_06945 [Candidatus Parcubacteria bacterium]|nr:hypothetical protein [Candidatus Parcubacteria bacterium]
MISQDNEKSNGSKGDKRKLSALVSLYKKEHPTVQEEKEKDKEIDKELKSIYKDKKGNMPNLTKLDIIPKNRARNLILISFSVLSIILIASLLGFFVFRPQPKFGGDKINLEIKAPFNVSAGEKVNYQIRLTNNEEVSLTKSRLTVYLPAGYIFNNSNLPAAANTEQNATITSIKTWDIGDLFIGQNKILDINGNLIGPMNSRQVISATLSYIPANFSSEFQKNLNFTTEINDSLLALNPEYTTQVADNELTEIKVKISNKSQDTPIINFQLELDFPPEFNLYSSQLLNKDQKASPVKIDKNSKAETSPKLIDVTSLLPQEEKTVIYYGKFTVTESQNIKLALLSKLKGPAEEYFSQKDAELNFEIVKGDLLTNLILQGSNQNKPLTLGENLNYLLSIENKSKKVLGDIKVRAVLDSVFLDWPSLNDKNKGMTEDNQILWTNQQIPGLALLLPEEEVTISFQIKLKNLQDVKNFQPEDLLVKSFFEAQINKINNADTQLISQSNTITNEFNTNLGLSAEGRYFGTNSETLGSGPLPPIVGQKTTYKIFWKLTNSLHEISNIEIKAKMPGYMNYEDQNNISTGNIYKNQDNEIVWQIARIPNTINQATAEFAISLTPQSQDVSKILTLLQDVTVTTTDSQTKGQITLTQPGLTTNLDSDPLGKGKGLIQAE